LLIFDDDADSGRAGVTSSPTIGVDIKRLVHLETVLPGVGVIAGF
jgi:hypothetical protein